MRHTIWTGVALLSLVSAAAAQDGGKLPWKGKGSADAKPGLAEAKRLAKPAMLFFTSEG